MVRRLMRPMSFMPDGRVPLHLVQRVDVHLVAHLLDHAAGIAAGVADGVLAVGLQRPLVEPADHHVHVLRGGGQLVRAHDHVAAADVDLVLKRERDALGAKASSSSRYRVWMVLIVAAGSRRQHLHGIALAEGAPRDTSCEAAEVMPLLGLRTDHVLHGEAAVDVVEVRADVRCSPAGTSAWDPGTRACCLPRSTTLSPFKRADGDVAHVMHLQLAAEILQFASGSC